MGSNESYTEYARRNEWDPGLKLQNWNASRIIKLALKVTGQSVGDLRLLEFGSGMGNLAIAAEGVGVAQYLGIEPNGLLRKIARERSSSSEFRAGSLPDDVPIVTELFDLVVAIHVLEHAENGYKAREWVLAMSQLVKPGGYILIISPDLRDYRTYFWDIDWSHCFPTTPKNVAQIMEDAGIEVVRSTTMRGGSLNGSVTVPLLVAARLTPTRALDAIARRISGRDLVSGFQIQVTWGATFALGRRVS